ncbi:MAG: helix-turn-helix domain-containing protein [Pseudomonadota bacterium]
MARKVDVSEKIIGAAFKLAAERGWRDLSLAEIAEAAKLPLSQVYPLFQTKEAILRAFSRRIDAEVLGDDSLSEDWDDAEGSARDRLFDVMMRRFDALAPYKPGIGHLLHERTRDPIGALCSLCQLRRSMAAMLEMARLPSQGPCGAVRLKGLSAIYLATLRVWLRDETPDMAKTMATLDGYLRRAEGLLRRLPRGARKR